MPPALSDEEGSVSADEMSIRSKSAKEEEEEVENGADEEDEDGAEDDEEVFVVEAILAHAFDGDEVLKYEVKWQGYEKKSDRTWEPEENLSGAVDILKAYHQKIGGRPKLGDAPPSKKRKQSNTPTVQNSGKARKNKRGAKDADGTPLKGKHVKEETPWEPPLGLWENDIVSVESIEKTIDVDTGNEVLMGYVLWANSKKSSHSLSLLYRKCPQKMLQYYERHLVFKGAEDE